MYSFTDRVPATGKANRKKISFEDGTVKYATIEYADDASPAGTPLNKTTFETMQSGLIPVTGSYTGDGASTKTITFDFSPSFVIFYCDPSWTLTSDGYAPRGNTVIIRQGDVLSNYYSLNGNILTLNTCTQNHGTFAPNTLGCSYGYIAFKA